MLFSWKRLLATAPLAACLATVFTTANAQDDSAPIANMSKGYFRGEMVRWEGTAKAGDLIARNSSGELYACGYDSKTYIEMARAKITVAKLEPGDPLEILVDRHPGTRLCYVRIVHVVPPQRPNARDTRRDTPRPALRTRALPRGDRTISGVVTGHDGEWLTLRTREGEALLRLRRDTQFFSDGQEVPAEALQVNQRVSVKAGPSLDGDLQAYQVNWGGIVTVR